MMLAGEKGMNGKQIVVRGLDEIQSLVKLKEGNCRHNFVQLVSEQIQPLCKRNMLFLPKKLLLPSMLNNKHIQEASQRTHSS
jgi:hypothetical protein